MNESTFNRCMKLMAATWPQRNPTPETAAAYWLVLNKLDDSVFEAAIAACLESCTFYPVPAEIIAKAKAVLAKNGLIPAPGEEAWAEVLRACSHWHPDIGWIGVIEGYESLGRLGHAPCPLPPLLEQAVRAVGGMSRIWNASDHDLGFIRQEFLAFYDHKREVEMAYNPNLLAQALPAPKSGPQLTVGQDAA